MIRELKIFRCALVLNYKFTECLIHIFGIVNKGVVNLVDYKL